MRRPTDLPDMPTWEPSTVRASTKSAPLGTLLASAKKLTNKDLSMRSGQSFGRKTPWQEDAWEMFDLVGEQRFLASTLAGRMSQARFYIGQLGDDTTEHPEPVKDEQITSIIESVGGSPTGRAQLVQRLAVNLFIAGDGWLVGVPRHLMPGSEEDEPPVNAEPDLQDYEWLTLSISEIAREGFDQVRISLGESLDEQVVAHPDDLHIIRVWRSHPRRSWEADSPTRASLPILRELVGLTMHISAQVDSRLAGAGLLVVPQSAQQSLQRAAGVDADTDSDVFTEALIEAMVTPISDRANASAVVPLVVTVPDEVTDAFQHISFSTPLDSEARNLRDEAIRRLALGQDAPPELLLGTAGMNHWGAWLVREDVVNTHLEPPLALICDALTTQYLWPVLQSRGMSDEEMQKYVVWFDVGDLVVQPNRVDDAKALYADGVISDKALRRETGFDDKDAPKTDLSDATSMALDLVRENPALLASPGLPSIVAQIREVSGESVPVSTKPGPATSAPADQPSPSTMPTPSTVKVPDQPGQPERPGP